MKIIHLSYVLYGYAHVRAAICTDSDWQDPQQLSCGYYSSSGLCSDHKFTEMGGKYSGSAYNFPELNCCACGKGKADNFYQEPGTSPYTCVQKAVNNKSKQVVEYCSKAQNKYQCTDFKFSRDLHCDWNAGKPEIV